MVQHYDPLDITGTWRTSSPRAHDQTAGPFMIPGHTCCGGFISRTRLIQFLCHLPIPKTTICFHEGRGHFNIFLGTTCNWFPGMPPTLTHTYSLGRQNYSSLFILMSWHTFWIITTNLAHPRPLPTVKISTSHTVASAFVLQADFAVEYFWGSSGGTEQAVTKTAATCLNE